MRKRCQRGTGPERMLNRGLISSSFDFISSTNIIIFFFSHFLNLQISSGQQSPGWKNQLQKGRTRKKFGEEYVWIKKYGQSYWFWKKWDREVAEKGLGQFKLFAHGFPDGGDGVGGGLGGRGEDENYSSRKDQVTSEVSNGRSELESVRLKHSLINLIQSYENFFFVFFRKVTFSSGEKPRVSKATSVNSNSSASSMESTFTFPCKKK